MGEAIQLGSQITFEDGQIVAHGTTPAEIKIAIKELRLPKKEDQAKKRDLAAEAKAIRAEYRSRVAHRTPMVRGGGMFGRIVRAGVAGKRASERGAVDDAVKPIETEIAKLDRNMLTIDRVIAQCESALLRMTD